MGIKNDWMRIKLLGIGRHPAIQVAREKESCGIIPAAGGSTGRHFVVPLDPVSAALNSIPSCDFSACVKAQDHFKRSFKRKE